MDKWPAVLSALHPVPTPPGAEGAWGGGLALPWSVGPARRHLLASLSSEIHARLYARDRADRQLSFIPYVYLLSAFESLEQDGEMR